jgi:CcmD family protein
MAYGALWILTAGFLVLLWLRQRRLTAEIERLDAKLARAAEE